MLSRQWRWLAAPDGLAPVEPTPPESLSVHVAPTLREVWNWVSKPTEVAFAKAGERGHISAGIMSMEGAISSMGKTRDEDGTVDRCPDPPQKMWSVLAAFMYKCEVENINIETVFEEGGGNHYGQMKTHKFFSSLKDNFGRFDIRAEILDDILNAYGVGYRDPRGRYENIAWKDFCEDVRKSKELDTSGGVAEAMSMTRGAELSYDALADKYNVYDDELEKLAAKDDGYHGHYHLTDKAELQKQSMEEARIAKEMGIDLLMVQGDGGIFEKARVLKHADESDDASKGAWS